ncbi:MAG: hypothetical protein GXY89_07405 [Tissierellia bacterium]|nr:hypothetical protein [Tissierellia bacterium]
MILELFPKKGNENKEKVGRFVVRYVANCILDFFDIENCIGENGLEKTIKYINEKTDTFLIHNFSEFPIFDDIYYTVEDLDSYEMFYDEELDSFQIHFNLIYEKILDLTQKEKLQYMEKGDAWIAENYMEDLGNFISQAYSINNSEYNEMLESIFYKLEEVPEFSILNFEAYSLVEVKDGYSYFDAFNENLYYDDLYDEDKPIIRDDFTFIIVDNVSYTFSRNEKEEIIKIAFRFGKGSGVKYEIDMENWKKLVSNAFNSERFKDVGYLFTDFFEKNDSHSYFEEFLIENDISYYVSDYDYGKELEEF